MLAPAAVGAVLLMIVGRGLAREAQRSHAARRELQAYLNWIAADTGLRALARR